MCKAACSQTADQSDNPLWHSLRYGRLTASVIHEASRAKESASLKAKIMGATKVPLTFAINRGRNLEGIVKMFLHNVSDRTKYQTNLDLF